MRLGQAEQVAKKYESLQQEYNELNQLIWKLESSQ